ncbi:MAG: hypothetical protein HQL37_06305 [Alphaproteobacteria bacterium]|nr:hypothetical protein [Alphaproteobacteria bacterium]
MVISGGVFTLGLAAAAVVGYVIRGRVAATAEDAAGGASHVPAPAHGPAQSGVTRSAATVEDGPEIAAIAAAVHAVLWGYRIVHIESAGSGTWAAEGRLIHQTGHSLSRHCN